jgi:hypothetical protein
MDTISLLINCEFIYLFLFKPTTMILINFKRVLPRYRRQFNCFLLINNFHSTASFSNSSLPSSGVKIFKLKLEIENIQEVSEGEEIFLKMNPNEDTREENILNLEEKIEISNTSQLRFELGNVLIYFMIDLNLIKFNVKSLAKTEDRTIFIPGPALDSKYVGSGLGLMKLEHKIIEGFFFN